MRAWFLSLFFLMASAGIAWAADPPAASLNPAGDPGVVLPATHGTHMKPGRSGDTYCFRLRTYRVRKGLDRGSLLPADPEETAFNPQDFDADNIVGYSTCQRAEKFELKTTDQRP